MDVLGAFRNHPAHLYLNEMQEALLISLVEECNRLGFFCRRPTLDEGDIPHVEIILGRGRVLSVLISPDALDTPYLLRLGKGRQGVRFGLSDLSSLIHSS